jgi:hypothetical protein
MFDLGFLQKIVVTLKAHCFAGPDQQKFIRGVMRCMAGEAFARFSRSVFDFGFFQKIVMALKAHRLARADQHLGVVGTMRFMARGALAVIGWLVFEFSRLQEISMTSKAYLSLSALDLHRIFFLFEWRMFGERRGRCRDDVTLDERAGSERTSILVVLDCRGLVCFGRATRNAIKEYGEPFLFGLSTASHQHRHCAEKHQCSSQRAASIFL